MGSVWYVWLSWGICAPKSTLQPEFGRSPERITRRTHTCARLALNVLRVNHYFQIVTCCITVCALSCTVRTLHNPTRTCHELCVTKLHSASSLYERAVPDSGVMTTPTAIDTTCQLDSEVRASRGTACESRSSVLLCVLSRDTVGNLASQIRCVRRGCGLAHVFFSRTCLSKSKKKKNAPLYEQKVFRCPSRNASKLAPDETPKQIQ